MAKDTVKRSHPQQLQRRRRKSGNLRRWYRSLRCKLWRINARWIRPGRLIRPPRSCSRWTSAPCAQFSVGGQSAARNGQG